MKEIVVLSGKGGTGKTSVVAALAHLASREGHIVLADADVDAANLGLVLAPEATAEYNFTGGTLAVIADDRCAGCGVCVEACRFSAIRAIATESGRGVQYRVDPLACEGCAACFYRCPVEAIRMEEQEAGRWFVAASRFGTLVHAHLFAGQENSGKLVTQVKRQARELAVAGAAEYLLVDGPPGIGCPVIATCAGADLALLVAEPTAAGVHDLERILATTEHFRVPALVCINKYDLSAGRSGEITDFCRSRGVEVAGFIPFDTAVTEAMVAGKSITEWHDEGDARSTGDKRAGSAVAEEIAKVWARVRATLSARNAQPATMN